MDLVSRRHRQGVRATALGQEGAYAQKTIDDSTKYLCDAETGLYRFVQLYTTHP